MTFLPLVYPHVNDEQVYACANCKTHLSTEENIESKEFSTANGRCVALVLRTHQAKHANIKC